MITVDAALGHLFELATPLGHETVPLRAAAGRVLAKPVVAQRNQPPFRSSAMDGYAVRDTDMPGPFKVIGEAAAGHAFDEDITSGEAVRIFTGAPLPDSADRIVIQEDVTRDGGQIRINDNVDSQFYVRALGNDFQVGTTLDAPRKLSPADIALIASMNTAEVTVYRQPRVAILATGDELVMPGEVPSPDQIIASNSLGLSAIVEAEGATAHMLPIARDTEESLIAAFALAKGADLLVTIGGASVGDHDLVGKVAADQGMERSFYKIAMRPGKPLTAGRLGDLRMIGLPGNPVSSMVCGHIFLRPVLRALQGLPPKAITRGQAPLGAPIAKNGPREHYVRALYSDGKLYAAERQDSALLTVLSDANALIVRQPHDTPKDTGAILEFIHL